MHQQIVSKIHESWILVTQISFSFKDKSNLKFTYTWLIDFEGQHDKKIVDTRHNTRCNLKKKKQQIKHRSTLLSINTCKVLILHVLIII